MQAYTSAWKKYSIDLDSDLDNLIQTNDPPCRKRLEKEIIDKVGNQRPSQQACSLSAAKLNDYAVDYGEQFVADASADLELYFDIINLRLFSGRITGLPLLYIFGTGQKYSPNISGLSAAGEGIAGYFIEQLGFTRIVRPIGKMPDVVGVMNGVAGTEYALVEAKASVSQNPLRLLQKNIFEFLLNIKLRHASFRNIYEGYLIASQFLDGRMVDSASLKVGLRKYWEGNVGTNPVGPPRISPPVEPPQTLRDRLRELIRVHNEISGTRDAYLTGLISEQAKQFATLELLRGGGVEYENADRAARRVAPTLDDVETYVQKVAEEMGFADSWYRGQELIKGAKEREEQEVIRTALEKATKFWKLTKR